MFKSNLKITFRNLWRHKASTFINVTGLAVALTASFLIYLYLSYEFSYDSNNDKANRIFRVVTKLHTPNEDEYSAAPYALGPALQHEFPEIEGMVRIEPESFGGRLVSNGDKKFQEDNILYADSSLFTIFSFPFVRGNYRNALSEPFCVVLSETAAEKYFGKADPIGQTLLMENFNVKVTGVIKDITPNSQFRSDIIISLITSTKVFNPGEDNAWYGSVDTYLLLQDGYNWRRLQDRLPAFLQKHLTGAIADQGFQISPSLEPLKSVYLYSKYGNLTKGNILNIYLFATIGIIILFIAAVNFVNLSTSRFTERAKEVGIRKIIGSSRKQLIFQFLLESLAISTAAFLLASLLTKIILPVFITLSGRQLTLSLFDILLLFLAAMITGLCAGIVPARIISSFNPVDAVKSDYRYGNRGILLRKILVISQFSLSIILIIVTIAAFFQLRYMRSAELGFKKDQMVVIDFHRDDKIEFKFEHLKEEFRSLPGIISASASFNIPGANNFMNTPEIENSEGAIQKLKVDQLIIDESFLDQYQMEIKAGRGFRNDFAGDKRTAILINEKAAEILGYRSVSDAVGKRFSDRWQGKIIGVIKDFHLHSLQKPIEPMIFQFIPDDFRYFTLNISNKNIPHTIKDIELKWKQLMPERPFNYFFLDTAFDQQYKSESNFGELFSYFTLFALFISCLGLFGLALFQTGQRTKEIGIRKVLGASVTGIASLLSKEYLKLVLIAFMIATPIAWFSVNKWLQNFAYRMDLSWWIFCIAGVVGLLVAFFTVSFQSFKLALMNPVKNLRNE